MKTWTVVRHAGRTGHPARVAFAGDEKRARSFYAKRSSELKQGSILLIDHAGGVQAYLWGTR